MTASNPALVDTSLSGRERRPRTLGATSGPGQARDRAGAQDRARVKDDPVPTGLPNTGARSPFSGLGRADRARRAKYLREVEERRAADEQSLPAYIHACFNNPKRHRTYWVYTWKPGEPENKHRVPYVCGSWKCQYCQQHAGHVLFARLQEAFKGLDPRGVVFAVLTLDPEWHEQARHDIESVYRDFSKRQNRWMKRLRRWLISEYGEDMGNRWASVTECHKSGVPHVNIAIHHPAWAEDLRKRSAALRAAGASEFEAIQADPQLLEHAQECGFGWRCSLEANRYGDTDAISGYLVKGVKRADAMHGEIAKLSQLPVMAPRHFRRLRAGKLFVPPKKKRGECTGTVIRRYWTPEGDEQTEPLSKTVIPPEPNPVEWPDLWAEWAQDRDRRLAYLAEVEHCQAIEQRMAWRDEDTRGPDADRVNWADRREHVTSFRRTIDGATIAGSGMVVLDAPQKGSDERDNRSTGRDGDRGRDSRGGPGPPRDGEPPAVHAHAVRIREVAHQAGQQSLDLGG